MHLSIASWLPASRFEASPATVKISMSLTPFRALGTCTVSTFLVSVPVLSLHRTSIPASASIEAKRDTMAWCFASACAPTAIVAVLTTCIAIGIEATISTTQTPSVSRKLFPLRLTTTRMIIAHTEAIARMNIATLNRIFWKLLRWFTLATRVDVFPKKVLRPVADTIASRSPRLITDPWNTSSPSYFVTARDSPVSAAWSTSQKPGPRIASAGTMSPSLILMRSPMTRALASMTTNSLSLLAQAFGASFCLSASMAFPALRSSCQPRKPFTNCKIAKIAKSIQSCLANSITMAAQIIHGIGPQ